MQSYRDFAGMPMENFPSSVLNRWHGEGTSNRLPRVTAVTNANYSNISDIYMHDADYVRISNLTVGYRFNEMLRSVNWMQAASVYVSFSTFIRLQSMTEWILKWDIVLTHGHLVSTLVCIHCQEQLCLVLTLPFNLYCCIV